MAQRFRTPVIDNGKLSQNSELVSVYKICLHYLLVFIYVVYCE